MASTPHLVVDLDVLEHNIARMARRAAELDVALRPHVKTHKIPAIADLQRAAGAHGITVATVGEAEAFVEAGHDDVFIAYPLWLDAEQGRALADLAQRATIRIGCDSVEAAAQTKKVLGQASIEVLLELDSGQRRSGVPAADAGELGRRIVDLGLNVGGVFTFPGHSYGTAEGIRASAAAGEAESLLAGAQALQDVRIEPRIRSGGSSPSMAYVDPSAEPLRATEMRPGAYVFNDAQQWEVGACTDEQIALTAHATVVSRNAAEGRIVLNSGSKTLSPDRPAWASGAGRLLDHPDARMVQLSEHHAVVEMAEGPVPELGSTVRAVPNHCCNAINLADSVMVTRAGRIVDTWSVAARGRNS